VVYAYYAWGYAQALASDGTVLGKTLVTRTYVPGQNLTVIPATKAALNIIPVMYGPVF
jgi:hypothetical protein